MRPAHSSPENFGLGGWIRTSVFLLPGQDVCPLTYTQMARSRGIEPLLPDRQSSFLPLKDERKLEDREGIEPIL